MDFNGFLIVGLIFGILGGVTAFVNAYEGYSHYPGILKRKRIIMSLEMAVLAVIMVMIAVGIVFFFIGRIIN